MANDYIRLVEARARQELEQLSVAQQRAIIEAYNSAGKQLVRSYRGAKDGTATKALLASYTQKIADETQQIIEQYAIRGAKIAPSVEKLIMQQAFQMAGLDTSVANDKFDNLIGKLGMESVKNIIGGKIYKDGAGLSARIWQASAMSSNKIQEVIAAGLAQDMGAAKLSKLLQDYVNPTARKTWSNDKIRELLGDGYAAWNKNLEYNALRLARTTLAHTATMSMRQAQKVNPYATKIMWHSVHAAGRTCSICEEMDGQVYDTDKCPLDHPNGMCYQTHEFEKSLNEMADELAAWCNGEPNEVLDEWWERTTGEKNSSLPKPLGISMPAVQYKELTSASPELSKLEKMTDGISDSELESLRYYTGYGYGGVNNYLRTGTSYFTEPEELMRHADNISGVLRRNSCPDNIVCLRGIGKEALGDEFANMSGFDFLQIKNNIESNKNMFVGKVYTDKGFMSTTVDTGIKMTTDAVLKIKVDKGHVGGAFLEKVTTNATELEYLLDRGTSLLFEDVVKNPNGVLEILCSIVGG